MSQTIELAPMPPPVTDVSRQPQNRLPPGDLRVALMGRSLRGQFSGVVRYTDELVGALAPHLGRNLSVFVTRGDDGLGELPIHRIRAPFPTPNEYTRAFWEQTVVPFDVRRVRPDVYHSPNYIIPAALPCPSVVTVHDVAFLDRSVHRLKSHLYLTACTLVALRKSARVVCVSHYTAAQIIQRFGWVREKVRVIGEGVGGNFVPSGAAAVQQFRDRYGIAGPYVLFVGTVEPRKNLPRLLRAFELAVSRHALPHDLVIAGAAGWKTGAVRGAYERSSVRGRINFIGYVPDYDLPAAYSGADAFVYPSLHEGFGLPPLEAMACGTPVITSDSTALAEVAGPAALTADPTNTEALAGAIASLLSDTRARERLRRAGLSHAAQFRWDAVAGEMLSLYREAAR
ncbi:MAG: glycosyltransferase family 4 protein [Chloroflexi bacterium]|nr:glycosyltransferase family 4 protein [Chloroflexota bacterium]